MISLRNQALRIHRRLLHFALYPLLASCALGGEGANAEDRYEIDSAHTHVQFSVMRFGFNEIIGEFRNVSGAIVLDKQAPENSAVSATIKTSSLESGDASRDEAVSGKFWLSTAAFPEITFTSTEIELTGEEQAKLVGELSILGVSQSVELDVSLNKIGADPATKKEAVGFSASGVLKRSEFGMKTALGMVGDDVTIRIEVLAHRAE